MKNKFISLACVIAMVFSIFGTFTIANADEAQTITSKAVLDGDNATITISYSGFTAVSALNFTVPLDPEVFDTSAFTAKNNIAKQGIFTDARCNLDNNELITTWNFGDDGNAKGSGDIIVINVPVKDKTKLPVDIELNTVSFTDEQAEKVSVTYGTKNQNPDHDITVVSGKLVDPNAPTPAPESPARPPKKDEPVVEPTKAPVTEGQRIEGKATVKDDVATITVSYAGFTAVSALNFTVPLDPEVFDTSAFTAKNNIAKQGIFTDARCNLDNNELITTWNFGDDGNAKGSGDIIVINVPVKDKTKLPVDIELNTVSFTDEQAEKVSVTYGTKNQNPDHEIGLNTITVSNPDAVVVEPKKVPLTNVIAKDAKEKLENATDPYITVEVKKGNTTAEYGKDKDYTVSYKGNELSEEAYSNLISGYKDGVKLADILSEITFNIYNKEVSTISTTVNGKNADGKYEQIAAATEANVSGTSTPKPTTAPAGPSISVKSDSSSVAFNNGFTVTATVSNAKDGAKVEFSTNDTENKYVTLVSTTDINNGKATATYLAKKEAGTVTITAKYTDDAKNEATASVKVTVKKPSTKPGGNDGTTSGGGPGIIAPGNGGATTTPNTDSSYKPDFQDLDSVEWARTAINGLAMRGMINGRDQYTFDPNANITRAEYCQILMGAINALNAKGESTFADVPSTAWYYNAVSVASQLGIVSGYGDGNFGPNDLITRQDMALMTYKTAQIMNKSLEPVNAEITFEDSHEIADYAFEAVMTLQKAGIINGMTDTTFEPHSNATRAQSAKVIFDTFVDAQ